MSKSEMMDLAEEHFFDELYQDARNSDVECHNACNKKIKKLK